MSDVNYSIEISIDRTCEDDSCVCDARRYRASILAKRKHLLSVAEEVHFDDVNVLAEWLKEAVDAWC